MQRITPCLWFDTQAEEAMAFYVSVIKNSRIIGLSRYGEGLPLPAGTVLTVTALLDGQEVMALNGGPIFTFSEAISLVVNCETQAELDDVWERLSAGGEIQQCGWLKDKYGLSWQVVPAELGAMMMDPDAARTQRVMDAIMTMTKLDIAALRRAYRGA